jgi:hypothetical protein
MCQNLKLKISMNITYSSEALKFRSELRKALLSSNPSAQLELIKERILNLK